MTADIRAVLVASGDAEALEAWDELVAKDAHFQRQRESGAYSDELRDAIAETEREIIAAFRSPAFAAMREDAERYQRIRLGLSERHGDVYAMVFGPEGDYPLMGPPLDAAIDAARAKP